MILRIRRLRSDAILPAYQTAGAAGMDLHTTFGLVLAPGERYTFPTGIAIQLPPGYEAQVRPRSGLAKNFGVVAVHGTVDGDYTGELGVTLINLGASAYTVSPGDRIAQLVVAPVARVVLEEVQTLAPTERGSGGFGSTGVGVDPVRVTFRISPDDPPAVFFPPWNDAYAALRNRLEEQKQIEPRERFQELIARGLITPNGRLRNDSLLTPHLAACRTDGCAPGCAWVGVGEPEE